MTASLDRIRSRILSLYEIGRQAGGGATRLSYTEEDRQAKELFAGWCRACGLSVRYDAAGNLLASAPGRRAGARPIALGSHLDTVPAGGAFDGVLGCVGALECAEVLAASGRALEHPFEIMVFADEEGSRFGVGLLGSRAMLGSLKAEELRRTRDAAGVSLWEAMAGAGFAPERLAEAARAADPPAAYLELHIEQGGVLESQGLPIGVVTSIVGIKRRELRLRGRANHAGTTPFRLRKDALMAAARIVVASRQAAMRIGGPASVATVGRLEARPGAINVVPGEADCSLEIRDVDEAVMENISAAILGDAARICAEEGVALEVIEGGFIPPVLLDRRIQEAVRAAAAGLGAASSDLPSGAGHDAQSMARLCPSGMIFVPSLAGISHSPLEDSSWPDVERGVQVLARAVELIDRADWL